MENPHQPTKDLCVLCGKETEYDRDMHINLREGYVEGSGQVCRECLTKQQEREKIREHLAASHLPRLVKLFRNIR